MSGYDARGLMRIMKTNYTKGNIKVLVIVLGGVRGKGRKIRGEERGNCYHNYRILTWEFE